MNSFLNKLFTGQDYNKDHFFLIAGPRVVESEDLVFNVAQTVSEICKRHKIPYVFKASYKKANRTSSSSFTGIGMEKGLTIIKKAAEKFSLPVTTDIHTKEEDEIASAYVDILQIPAF